MLLLDPIAQQLLHSTEIAHLAYVWEDGTPRGFEQQGNTYTAPGYATAANRVELAINGGVGTIRIGLE